MHEMQLSDGHSIPAIGLGTFRSKPDQVVRAVKHALSVGYRHIDGAEAYGNEAEVGRAVRESEVPRDRIFITGKLWNTHRDTAAAKRALEKTLTDLGTDYLDLYLIHWPGPTKRVAEVWSAMEDAVEAGKVRSIGVSNFHIHRINTLKETARRKPVVNQVECHPELQNVFLRDFSESNGMLLEAYAPLNSDHVSEMLENKMLKRIADIHGKTVAQVVLRWHIQRGIVPLPKSVNPSRIEENFGVFDFELSEQEMKGIRRLNSGTRHFPEPDNVDFGFGID